MTKEQKRLLILVAVLLVAGVYLLYDKSKGTTKITKTAEITVKPLETPQAPTIAMQRTPADRRPPSTSKARVERTWGRDPFQPPEGVEIVETDQQQRTDGPQEEPLPNVTCIIIKGSQRIATIGDTNCSVGDMVGKQKVVEILPDRVILKKGNTKSEILLEGEGISVVKKVK